MRRYTRSVKSLIGKETALALNNFPFRGACVDLDFIYAIVQIKKAAAAANFVAANIGKKEFEKISLACDAILSGKYNNQFLLPELQGGAGTSINANVNEVIASLTGLHANDVINRSQSTNDVLPSALRVTVYKLGKKLVKDLFSLSESLGKKALEFKGIRKLARTHMQDAVPIFLQDEFGAYSFLVKKDTEKFETSLISMLELNLGGTAVGNSLNASRHYIKNVYKILARETNLKVHPSKNFMALTGSSTDFLKVSQALVSVALNLSKIASDLRFLSSGPKGGIGELVIPKLQAGSSIMPGKVNPVIPEVVNQFYFTVSGNNLTIEHACANAHLELSIMMPVIVSKLIYSLKLASEVIKVFEEKCIKKLSADKGRCEELLKSSTANAASLTPKLGYDTLTKMVEEITARS